MNKYLLIISFCLLMTACKKDNASEVSEGQFRIEGEASGIADGTKVLLKRIDENGQATSSDTSTVANEQFSFKGEVDIPAFGLIELGNHTGFVPIIIENNLIKVAIDKDAVPKSKIYNSVSNELMMEYNDTLNSLRKNNIELNRQYRKAKIEKDTANLKALESQIKANQSSLIDFPYEFIKNTESSNFSLFLIENLIRNKQANKDKTLAAFNTLDKDLKDSQFGKKIYSLIEGMPTKTNLNIGDKAPSFKAPNPEGKVIALEDVLSKVTIIDFWASWCKPCRRENPNVVKLYEKYHNKGLEIIGVSLDKEAQKDRWIKAIEDDGLTWPQISNLKSWNEPIARLYNVRSIPATYILDENGVIIAKNLRGQALENKIAELLD